MDYIGFIKGIISQVSELLKSIIEIAKPIVSQILSVIVPIFITIFTTMIKWVRMGPAKDVISKNRTFRH
jgi:phage-related protein